MALPEIPPANERNSILPYVWATVILFLIGVIFTGMILYLRPMSDPLIVIGTVMGFVVSIGSGIGAMIKSQETHLTVNGQLSQWKQDFGKMSHAQGLIDGAKQEQERVAETMRVAVTAASVVDPRALAAAVAPLAVVPMDKSPGS